MKDIGELAIRQSCKTNLNLHTIQTVLVLLSPDILMTSSCINQCELDWRITLCCEDSVYIVNVLFSEVRSAAPLGIVSAKLAAGNIAPHISAE